MVWANTQRVVYNKTLWRRNINVTMKNNIYMKKDNLSEYKYWCSERLYLVLQYISTYWRYFAKKNNRNNTYNDPLTMYQKWFEMNIIILR